MIKTKEIEKGREKDDENKTERQANGSIKINKRSWKGDEHSKCSESRRYKIEYKICQSIYESGNNEVTLPVASKILEPDLNTTRHKIRIIGRKNKASN